jgi:hypothetical protein
VMESVADALVEKVKAKVAKLTVGPPEENCDITPVVSESSANYIEGLVKDAKQKEATFCQEYRREGNLIWPLLLDNVRPDMRIAWEEPFGPVLLKKESTIAMLAILDSRYKILSTLCFSVLLKKLILFALIIHPYSLFTYIYALILPRC